MTEASDAGRPSAPMSPLPPRFDDRQPTGRHAALTEDDTARALRIGLANRAALGRAPNAAVPGDAGEGIWGLIYALQLGLAQVQATGTAILARLDADRAINAGRGGWLARRAEKLVDGIAWLAVAAALAYLAGFHR